MTEIVLEYNENFKNVYNLTLNFVKLKKDMTRQQA